MRWDIYELGSEVKVLDNVTSENSFNYSDPVKFHMIECGCSLGVFQVTGKNAVLFKIEGSPRFDEVWGEACKSVTVKGGDAGNALCEKPFHQIRVAYKSKRKDKHSVLNAWVLTR